MAGLGSVQLRKWCFYCAQLPRLRNVCQTRVYLSPVQNTQSDYHHHQPTVARIYFIPCRLVTEKSELFWVFLPSDCTMILCAKKPLKRNRKSVRDYVWRELSLSLSCRLFIAGALWCVAATGSNFFGAAQLLWSAMKRLIVLTMKLLSMGTEV